MQHGINGSNALKKQNDVDAPFFVLHSLFSLVCKNPTFKSFHVFIELPQVNRRFIENFVQRIVEEEEEEEKSGFRDFNFFLSPNHKTTPFWSLCATARPSHRPCGNNRPPDHCAVVLVIVPLTVNESKSKLDGRLLVHVQYLKISLVHVRFSQVNKCRSKSARWQKFRTEKTIFPMRGCESVVLKGGIKPVQIMTERRSGNKKVTKVSWMETFLIDPDSFGSELQKKFACSTSVGEFPGKKGYEVLIQGGVIEDVARYMVEHYGVPKRYIEVYDKTARK